jgi:predicted 3-demethylubiquinone-9 3-methyltransferase (glyoxalase superfamily)
MKDKLVTCLWFDTEGEAAARFYTSVFPGSKLGEITRYGSAGPREEGTVMTVGFELMGQEFIALNGGPDFTFNEAISLLINCADQAEVDYYWNALTADGGEEGPCGWLKDKYGLSWQVVPEGWEAMLTSGDTAAAQRAMDAMYTMKKLDLAALQAAYDGTED